MKTIRLDDFTQSVEPCVATIGFFDGVHKGHQFLIRHVMDEAKAAGLQSTVITFDKHPRQVLQEDYIPEMLSTLDSKLLLLSKTGVDNSVVLRFNKEMAELSAREFMAQVLRDRLHVKKLIIGYDNRFGHNREEGFDDYVRFGEELGIEVIKNEAFLLNGINVSSSVVRAFLKEGEIEMANSCLGYHTRVSRLSLCSASHFRLRAWTAKDMSMISAGCPMPQARLTSRPSPRTLRVLPSSRV